MRIPVALVFELGPTLEVPQDQRIRSSSHGPLYVTATGFVIASWRGADNFWPAELVSGGEIEQSGGRKMWADDIRPMRVAAGRQQVVRLVPPTLVGLFRTLSLLVSEPKE